MMLLKAITIFSVLFFTVLGQEIISARPPKKYVVNLDLPEEERWVQVVQDHKEIVKDAHTMFR